jgi:transposase-like protein
VCSRDNYAGRLRGVTPRGARDEDRRVAARAHEVRSSKYLNNVIEQDHRYIKSRVNVMLGLNVSETRLSQSQVSG